MEMRPVKLEKDTELFKELLRVDNGLISKYIGQFWPTPPKKLFIILQEYGGFSYFEVMHNYKPGVKYGPKMKIHSIYTDKKERDSKFTELNGNIGKLHMVDLKDIKYNINMVEDYTTNDKWIETLQKYNIKFKYKTINSLTKIYFYFTNK